MKSQRILKEIVKTEKLPQGQGKVLSTRQNKNEISSNVYTVKETTLEKRVKRTYNTEGPSNKSLQITSSNLKQGTNSGYIAQNKIPVSNKEDNKYKDLKTSKSTKNNFSERFRVRRYTKKDYDKIIKIQRWWRRILAILDGYKIRESLFNQNRQDNVIRTQQIITERNISDNNQLFPQILKSPNTFSSLNNINTMNNSKSYTNINNVYTNIKRNLNTTHMNTSSSQNYIQTIDKRIITQSSPFIVQSVSTSPSVKSKYIIETKKVEVFRKPKNYSATKYVKETNLNTINSMSHYEIKQMMRDIWNDETYCSTVESLCCLGDDRKSNVSQNTMIFEEYEEEIRKLKTLLMQKDDEINNLMANLKETRKELNVNITKNMRIKGGYGQKKLDQDAHELQIISTKLGWNDVNIPSPVNEIFIESIENKIPPRMQYIEGMQIMGNERIGNMERWSQKIRTEESIQESVSDPEAVLEIQEMNALSIISSKIKPKNICQHLQSLMILSKRNEEQSEEYSVNIKEKEEKTGIEIIPIEKEPLVFQKIEQINIRSKPKPRKPRNQIQELDGLEIINYRRPLTDLKRKVKPKLVSQNVDKICIQSLVKKVEKRNIIQELDGIEIIKAGKEPYLPQCVDELEIMREYDMLLVKPTWNSLQIQGSGLNLLALPRDMGLENQEVDEFEILGMEKPELFVQSLENVTYEKPNVLKKIQVLIPLPENNIETLDNFKIRGVKKEPEVKIVEKIVEKKETMKIVPNKILQLDQFLIKGKVKPNIKKVSKLDTLFIKGKEKVDNKKQINLDKFDIKGKEKEDNKIVALDEFLIKGKEKVENIQIMKPDKIQLKGKERKVARNTIIKIDKIKIEGLEREVIEEKAPEENIEENVVEISILTKQKIVTPNQMHKLERFKIDGAEQKKVGPNKIINLDRFKIMGVVVKKKNEVNNLDNFRFSAIKKEENKIDVVKGDNIIESIDKINLGALIKEENMIDNIDKFNISGLVKVKEENKIEYKDNINLKGFVKETNKIKNLDRFNILGIPKKDNKINNLERFRFSGKVKEDNEIDNLDNLRFSAIKKIEVPNQIKQIERFEIKGIQKSIEEEYIPVKRKGFAEKIKKTIKKKDGEKKDVSVSVDEKKIELYPQNTESLVISRAYTTKQTEKIFHQFNNLNVGQNSIVSLYGTPKKVTKVENQKIVSKGEQTKVIEKLIEKDWNQFIKPVKTTKLLLRNAYDKVRVPKQQIIEKKEVVTVEQVEKKEIPQVIERVGTIEIISEQKKPKIPKKEIVEKEEIEVVEKVYKNWNDEIKAVKSTILNIEGKPKLQIVQKKVETQVINKEERPVEKEKIEFDIESFALNFQDSGKKFRETLYIENAAFDLEGNKGMILKEGPAKTIKITKEVALVPSKTQEINLKSKLPNKIIEKVISKNEEEVEKTIVKNWNDLIRPSRANDVTIIQKTPKKVVQEKTIIKEERKVSKEFKETPKPKVVLKSVKENKLFINGIKPKQVQQVFVEKKKEINWNDINTLSKGSSFNYLNRKKPSMEIKQTTEKGEKIKTVEKIVEKIVEVEKKIDWNKFNKIDKKDKINLLHKKKTIALAKQRTNTLSLFGIKTEKNKQILQKIEKVEKIEKRDWTKSLHAQRNAKFALYGKRKIKKNKLLVANGDKFFIQKESDDEIIYNDDYNSRKDKIKLKSENEGEQKTKVIKEKEIIKEKEYVPRLQREIRAQISKLRESESETSSSIGEIDVLAGIKKKKAVGYAAATGEADADLLNIKKTGELNGYQTKVMSGEVIFTAKNGLGVNLGGTQYQKQIKNKVGYTKRLSNASGNKMSGIEINLNPRVKSEVYYQKLTGASGAIADGNYKLIGTKSIINDKGLSGSISCKQMKIITNNITGNNPESDLGNNGQQTYKKQIIITSKTESGIQNELNGQPGSTRIIFNNRTIDNKNNGNKKKDSPNSGNNKKLKESPSSGNNIKLRESNNSSNNYDINQQMSTGKVVFNSRLKIDNSTNIQNASRMGQGQNKAISTRREYEMRVKKSGDRNNEQVITETKKVTEVNFKKNKKTKNVEPLRDYDSQNSF